MMVVRQHQQLNLYSLIPKVMAKMMKTTHVLEQNVLCHGMGIPWHSMHCKNFREPAWMSLGWLCNCFDELLICASPGHIYCQVQHHHEERTTHAARYLIHF